VPEVQGTPIQSFIIPLLKVTFTNSNGATLILAGGESPGLVYLDSGTSFFSLPSQLANAIYNALNVDLGQGFPIVACNLASTSTAINLSFQGITIAIPIGQLIIDNGGSSCQLGLSINSGTSFLGETALSSMYMIWTTTRSHSHQQ
jgi:hypothetical protein